MQIVIAFIALINSIFQAVNELIDLSLKRHKYSTKDCITQILQIEFVPMIARETQAHFKVTMQVRLHTQYAVVHLHFCLIKADMYRQNYVYIRNKIAFIMCFIF